MKPDSLKELQGAVAALSIMNDLNPEEAENVRLAAIDRIKAAIFMETPQSRGKFNLYDYCYDEMDTRPALCGVFHDEGWRVATDSHVLVAVKDDYDEALEHKIIGKDGREVMAKYPKWKSVIPTDLNGYDGHAIDTAQVYDLVRKVKAENKLAGKYGEKARGVVKVGKFFFKDDKLAQACRFMDHYGITELRTYERGAAKAVAPDGSLCIVMPIYLDEKEWKNPTIKSIHLEFA